MSFSEQDDHIEAARTNLEYAAELLASNDGALVPVTLIAIGHALMAQVEDKPSRTSAGSDDIYLGKVAGIEMYQHAPSAVVGPGSTARLPDAYAPGHVPVVRDDRPVSKPRQMSTSTDDSSHDDVGTELPTCPKCHTWYGVGGCRHTPSAGAGTCEPSAAILGRGEPSHEGTTVAEPLSPANPALPTVGCDTPGCTNAAKPLWAPGDGTETYLCDVHAGPDGPTDVSVDASGIGWDALDLAIRDALVYEDPNKRLVIAQVDDRTEVTESDVLGMVGAIRRAVDGVFSADPDEGVPSAGSTDWKMLASKLASKLRTTTHRLPAHERDRAQRLLEEYATALQAAPVSQESDA